MKTFELIFDHVDGLSNIYILDAAGLLAARGIECSIVDMHTIKPLDVECLNYAISKSRLIVTVEEHNIIGGLGSAVAEVIAEYGKGIGFKRVGLTGFSKGYGSHEEVKAANGVGRRQIKETILNMVG